MSTAKTLDGATHLPIAALFGRDHREPNMEIDAPQILADADIIFGQDVMDQHYFLVYGRQLLKRIHKSRKPEALRVLVIEIDQETDELELLIVLMEKTKGRCDYQSSQTA